MVWVVDREAPPKNFLGKLTRRETPPRKEKEGSGQ